MNNEEINVAVKLKTNQDEQKNVLQNALRAIAQEVQRFHSSEVSSLPKKVYSEEIFEKLNMVKSSLKSKRRQVKKLHKNLKTACAVARTVISTKETETSTLSKHIQQTRAQCEDLLKNNKENSKVIAELKLENEKLKDRVKSIDILIKLGYQELQKLRNMPCENISPIQQLKEIIVCCGQYYADANNTREKLSQADSRNRFLNHKTKILSNNLDTTTEELNSVRHQNTRLLRGASIRKQFSNEIYNIEELQSVYNLDRTNSKIDEKSNNSQILISKKKIDLSSHMSLVKTLLDDQDNMLKELKQLSEELNISDKEL